MALQNPYLAARQVRVLLEILPDSDILVLVHGRFPAMKFLSKITMMMPRIGVVRSRTLSRLQVLMASLFLTGAGLMCFVFVRNEWASAASQVIAGGESVSEVLAATAEEALKEGRGNMLQAVVSRLNEDRQIAYIEVKDSEGAVVADGGRIAVGRRLAEREPSDWWETHDTRYFVYDEEESGQTHFVIEKAVMSGGVEFGRVRVACVRPALAAFIVRGLNRGEVGLFGLAFLLMVGNYLVHVSVRPIVRLKRAMQAAQESDWRRLAESAPKGGDAGEIAAGMTSIFSRLDKEHRMLTDSNRELQVSNRVILFEKRRTEALIDSLSEAVVVCDSYGKITLMNREAEAVLSVGREAVLGKAAVDVFEERRDLVRLLTADTTGTLGRRTVELDFSDDTGRRTVRVQVSKMAGPSDGQGGTVLMMRDITQLKMEEQARRDFISNVAHELRAPLSAIKSYVEMLIDNEADTPQLRAEFFNTINEEADRLSRLIDNMLNISKIEVGGLVLNRSSVKTRKLLEDALASVYGTAKGKQIELMSQLPEDMPDAELDKELVRVIMMNLLGNAIKYTEPGGKVVLAGEVEANELKINVVDTGWGIPPDEQEKVFEKFYRGKRTANEKVTGNGLGLALAREIACLHGGDLRLVSEEGKGSKFTLCLPLS